MYAICIDEVSQELDFWDIPETVFSLDPQAGGLEATGELGIE